MTLCFPKGTIDEGAFRDLSDTRPIVIRPDNGLRVELRLADIPWRRRYAAILAAADAEVLRPLPPWALAGEDC